MQSGAAAAARAAAKEVAQKKKLMAMMGSAKKSTDHQASALRALCTLWPHSAAHPVDVPMHTRTVAA